MNLRPTSQTQIISRDMHTFVGKNIEAKTFIKCIPSSVYCAGSERVFQQRSESGPSELDFHVASGPGELVYRAENQPRSFNYRPSPVSTENGMKRALASQRAAGTVSCRDLKLSSLVALVYL